MPCWAVLRLPSPSKLGLKRKSTSAKCVTWLLTYIPAVFGHATPTQHQSLLSTIRTDNKHHFDAHAMFAGRTCKIVAVSL